MISIVVPVFNEEKTIAALHRSIVGVLAKRGEKYEIIFVDDGSSDHTAEAARNLHPLLFVKLQRNFGQTAAIDVGIQESSGDIIALLDADLQNDPAEIATILQKIDEGYDVVIGRRLHRKDRLGRMIFSRFANMCARIILGVKLHDFGCGLKAYRGKFIKDFRLWGESLVSLVAVAKERGAKICEVPVNFRPRESGTSKIKISHMIRGGFDLVGVAFFVRYFSRPLRFFGWWGIFSILFSFVVFGTAVALRLAGILNLTETPLPIIGTLFMVLGVLLFMMGLIAEVLLRIYYNTSHVRPYMIKEIIKQ